jgi:hypothetical protein
MNITDDSRHEPDFSRVHLQWFAGEAEDGGEDAKKADDGEKDVGDEVAELQKQLAALKKETAGKDRKVSELLEETKRLKETKSKEKERERRKFELEDMTKEELAREIERREAEIKSEYEQELNKIREENKQNAYVQSVYRVAPEIENLPPFMIKLLLLSRDAEDDKIKDALVNAKNDMDVLINKNRLVLGNREKVAHQPRAGEYSNTKIPTKREWEKMDEYEQRRWATYASDEDLKKINEY